MKIGFGRRASAARRRSRRGVRRDLAVALVLGATVALTACGSSGGGATASSSASAGTSASGTSKSGGALTGAQVTQIKKLIGPILPATSGAGKVWKVGLALPLSGSLNYLGTTLGDGAKLAAQQIPQLGGPKIELDSRDIATATSALDPAQAAIAAQNFHDGGIGSFLTMGWNGYGALNPWVAKYHILSMDPGAGVGPFPSKPYFWGLRPDNPGDNVRVDLEYAKKKFPSATTVSLAFFSGPTYAAPLQDMTDIVKQEGYKLNPPVLSQIGTTDFSNVLSQIRAQHPDLVVLALSGSDFAYFMKQYKSSGLTAPVLGVAYSAQAEAIAGSAFDGMYYAEENWLPTDPPNSWGSIMTDTYRAEFGAQGSEGLTPDNLTAAFYSGLFDLWQIYRRVLAAGGNPNSGAVMQAALAKDPNLASIFGGSQSTIGSVSLDPQTHAVVHLPYAVYQVVNGLPKLLATGDASGGPLTLK